MKTVPIPKTVTLETMFKCPAGCGWHGMLGESKIAIYLDWRPEYFIPANQGGNGYVYRCPDCKEKLFYTKNDHKRKDIAPEGHQFKQIIG